MFSRSFGLDAPAIMKKNDLTLWHLLMPPAMGEVPKHR